MATNGANYPADHGVYGQGISDRALFWIVAIPLAIIFAVIVAALSPGGGGPCAEYSAYYDKHMRNNDHPYGWGANPSASEQAKTQRLLNACNASGGDPVTGRDR